MSEITLAVNFAFSDSTTKSYIFGPLKVNAISASEFKNRLRNFNSVDSTSQKKFTNIAESVKSDNGYALTGIKSATITTSQTRRIFDAATYNPI